MLSEGIGLQRTVVNGATARSSCIWRVFASVCSTTSSVKQLFPSFSPSPTTCLRNHGPNVSSRLRPMAKLSFKSIMPFFVVRLLAFSVITCLKCSMLIPILFHVLTCACLFSTGKPDISQDAQVKVILLFPAESRTHLGTTIETILCRSSETP